MDIENLRNVQQKERETDSLQELRDSFYSEVGDFLTELEQKREDMDDPFSPEARRVDDTIQSARDIVDGLYERRVGKIIKLASLSASDVSVDESGMTREEKKMYRNVVSEIEKNQEKVLQDVIAGDGEQDEENDTQQTDGSRGDGTPATRNDGAPPRTGDASSPQRNDGDIPPTGKDAEPQTGVKGSESRGTDVNDTGVRRDTDAASGGDGGGSDTQGSRETVDVNDVVGEGASNEVGFDEKTEVEGEAGGSEGGFWGTDDKDRRRDGGARNTANSSRDSSVPDSGAGDGYVTVRVTEDIPGFVGVDGREYQLNLEDVATVPESNAEPLCSKDVAERID